MTVLGVTGLGRVARTFDLAGITNTVGMVDAKIANVGHRSKDC